MQTGLVRSMNILRGPTGIETYAQHTVVAQHTMVARHTWWLHDIQGGYTDTHGHSQHLQTLRDTH